MTSEKKPTKQQVDIIEYPSNTVVLAKPGSGKTFTIAKKIKNILVETRDFQGVIAISYTNKASKELKERVLAGGTDKKNSCFSTMTSFYLMEIIYPFGKFLFGNSKLEFKVCGNNDSGELITKFRNDNQSIDYLNLTSSNIDEIASLYRSGLVPIESIDSISNYIVENCLPCSNYLKARYTHVFIDEYQDCGFMQNEMFLKLVCLGIIGVAVGDIDQSIFGFAGKSAEYLNGLISNSMFRPFYLMLNFRCHKSISDYSLRLLNPSYQMDTECENRVVSVTVNGGEYRVAAFIDYLIPLLKIKYNLKKNSDFAILIRSENTGELVTESLQMKYKFFKKTPLDSDSSLWGSLFKQLLYCINGNELDIYQFCSEYFNQEEEQKDFEKLYEISQKLRNSDKSDYKKVLEYFKNVGDFLYPTARSEESLIAVNTIIRDRSLLETFGNVNPDEVQIMTLHKSKGLEFAVVFHLNLHKYILPSEGRGENGWGFNDINQCTNLHYVGITRAEELCILVCNTERKNGSGDSKEGIPSIFLKKNNLNCYRTDWGKFIKKLKADIR